MKLIEKTLRNFQTTHLNGELKKVVGFNQIVLMYTELMTLIASSGSFST